MHKGSIGLGTLLFLIFLVLKLTGHITWSWFWVVAPLIFSTVATITIIAFMAFMIIWLEGSK